MSIVLTRIELSVGDTTATSRIIPDSDSLILILVVDNLGTDSQVSLVVTASDGQSLGKVTVNGAGDKTLPLLGLNTDVDFYVECTKGRAAVIVERDQTRESVFSGGPKDHILVSGLVGPTAIVVGTTLVDFTLVAVLQGSSITDLGAGQFRLDPLKNYKLTSYVLGSTAGGGDDFVSVQWHDQTAGQPGVPLAASTIAQIVEAGFIAIQGASIAYVLNPPAPVIVAMVAVGPLGGTPGYTSSRSALLIEVI